MKFGALIRRKMQASADPASDRRLAKMARKTAEFHQLRAGWYFGRGNKISSDAIGYAIFLLKLANAEGLWRCNVFPRVEGGVRIDFVQSGHEIEVSIDSDGVCSIAHDVGEDTIASDDELTFGQAAILLRTGAKKVCISEQFTPSTSTTKRVDSVQWPVSHPVMAAFLSSAKNVQLVSRDRSIRISEGITQKSRPTRQFFGESTPRISLQMSIGSSSRAQRTMIPAM